MCVCVCVCTHAYARLVWLAYCILATMGGHSHIIIHLMFPSPPTEWHTAKQKVDAVAAGEAEVEGGRGSDVSSDSDDEMVGPTLPPGFKVSTGTGNEQLLCATKRGRRLIE